MRSFRLLPFLLLLFFGSAAHAQVDLTEEIAPYATLSDVKMQIYFLAADEFRGRDTGTSEIDIAGRYIATWFMTNGVQPFSELEEYYQPVPFKRLFPPQEGEITIGDSVFVYNEQFLVLNDASVTELTAPVVLLEYGSEQELAEADVEGKIVIVQPGVPGQASPQQWFMNVPNKNELLQKEGALAVIELYNHQTFPWAVLVNALSQASLTVDRPDDEGGNIPHIWINSTEGNLHQAFREMNEPASSISIVREPAETVSSNNVIGYIEGSDPELREEYLLLGAHYDHTGVVAGQAEGDYVYNGARDNAVGTAAIMLAARYFAENPPRRSVIFAAWTAEEMGLLGSGWFANNPPLPLDRIIYHLNIDGAGYNDTTKVTVIGLERTEAEEDLRSAAASFGLEAIVDQMPEQNLFDRSDNVHFARNGIPSPTYSLGITAFDEEINHYYHTVEDEPDTIDYNYITSYIRSFILASRLIADAETAPFWREGDAYEEAGLQLYGLETEQTGDR
ncbi:MAG: M28 family peptidase [Balneolaceae bacterium]